MRPSSLTHDPSRSMYDAPGRRCVASAVVGDAFAAITTRVGTARERLARPCRLVEREEVRAVDEHGASAGEEPRQVGGVRREAEPLGALPVRMLVRADQEVVLDPVGPRRAPPRSGAAENVRRRSGAAPPSPRATRRTTSRPACRARRARARPARPSITSSAGARHARARRPR